MHTVDFQFRCTGCDIVSNMTVRVPSQAPFEEETPHTLQNLQVLHCSCLEWRYPLLDFVLQDKILAAIANRHFRCTHTHEAPEQDGLQGACYNYGFMQVNMDNYGLLQVNLLAATTLHPAEMPGWKHVSQSTKK
jgi:hypothetical protein